MSYSYSCDLALDLGYEALVVVSRVTSFSFPSVHRGVLSGAFVTSFPLIVERTQWVS
jgi:hypothetical protein